MLADGETSTLLGAVRNSLLNSDAPVIAISGNDSAQLQSLEPAAAVVDIGPKPIDEERLVKGVRNIFTQTKTPIRVLHVEDDRDLQQVVKRLLPADWAVADAMTPADASALLDAEPIDLVLLDLALPDGGGEMLLDQVGAAEVVIFSASETAPALTGRVASALVKSRTTEFQLRDHLLELMATRADPRTSA